MKTEEELPEIPEQTAAPNAVRGKYYDRYMAGSNVILLAPDVAEAFRDSETVNQALREYLREHGSAPSETVR